MFIISLKTENLWTSWCNPITEEWFNGDPKSSQVSQKRRIIGIEGVLVSFLFLNRRRMPIRNSPVRGVLANHWHLPLVTPCLCWARVQQHHLPPARPLPGPFALWDSQEQAVRSWLCFLASKRGGRQPRPRSVTGQACEFSPLSDTWPALGVGCCGLHMTPESLLQPILPACLLRRSQSLPLRLALTSPFCSVQRLLVATPPIARCADGLRAWPFPP